MENQIRGEVMDMVERVARAMAWQNGCVWSELPQEVEEGDEDQQSYLDMARAAIEAMREPTEAMVWTGTAYLDAPRDRASLARVQGSFTTMIDVALAGK